MLILPSRKIAKPCCSNCGSGKPCCGKKRRRRDPYSRFFHKHRGLWLPRPNLRCPVVLLNGGYPSPIEWSGGRFAAGMPMPSVTFDLSCLGCCACETCVCCVACPEVSEFLQFRITGLVDTDFCTCTAFGDWEPLTNSSVPNESCHWEYGGLNLCTDIIFDVDLEIVKEGNECILRLTFSGDSSGGSGGGGGPYTVIFEKI
jgi:hypothetical protein